MAYVDPGTFVAAAALTAAQMNVIGDDIRYLKAKADINTFEGIALARTTNQSIATATWTAISWSSASIMVGGTWWTSGATITVPAGTVPSGYTSAILEISASARFDVNGTGVRFIDVTVNGAEVEQSYATSGLASDTTPVQIIVWAQVADGDTIQVRVDQNSGGALNCSHGVAHIKRIGAI